MNAEQAANAAAVTQMIHTAVTSKEKFAIVDVANSHPNGAIKTFHFALKYGTYGWSDKPVWSLYNATLDGEPDYHWFYIAGFADSDADTLTKQALQQLGDKISPLFQHPNEAA
jgi:hypothetical protein